MRNKRLPRLLIFEIFVWSWNIKNYVQNSTSKYNFKTCFVVVVYSRYSTLSKCLHKGSVLKPCDTPGTIFRANKEIQNLNTPPWVFFTFFELYKWYQIAQRITYSPFSHLKTWTWTWTNFKKHNSNEQMLLYLKYTNLLFLFQIHNSFKLLKWGRNQCD